MENSHKILFNIFEKEKLRENSGLIGDRELTIFRHDKNAILWSLLEERHWLFISNLLTRGPRHFLDMNFVDADNRTALIIAVLWSSYKPDMIELIMTMIESGTEVDFRPPTLNEEIHIRRDEYRKMTALEIALTPILSLEIDKEGQFVRYADYFSRASAALVLLAAGADPFDLRVRDKRCYQEILKWLNAIRIVREKCGKHRFIGDTVAEFLYNEQMLLKAIQGVDSENLVDGNTPEPMESIFDAFPLG